MKYYINEISKTSGNIKYKISTQKIQKNHSNCFSYINITKKEIIILMLDIIKYIDIRFVIITELVHRDVIGSFIKIKNNINLYGLYYNAIKYGDNIIPKCIFTINDSDDIYNFSSLKFLIVKNIKKAIIRKIL